MKLRKLLSKACDSGLTATQMQQIESLIDSDPSARDEYVDFVTMEALLEQRSARSLLDKSCLSIESLAEDERLAVDVIGAIQERERTSSGPEAQQGTAAPSSTTTTASGNSTKHEPKRPALRKTDGQQRDVRSSKRIHENSSIRALLAVAASIALLASFWLTRGGSFASVVAIDDVTWSEGVHFAIGDTLGDDWVEIQQGTIKLAFHDKALVALQGPARFQVVSKTEGLLERGTLTAHVPAEAVGFTVRSRDLTVVDLGTGFELSVDEKTSSRVHVMEGRVRVEAMKEKQHVELVAGQLAKYNPARTQGERLEILRPTLFRPRTGGSLSYNPEHPESLGYRAYTSDEIVHVFLENSFLDLPCEVRINHTSPGSYNTLELPRTVLNTGTRVHSYLLHYSPNSGRRIVQGSVTFPGKILGIIGDTDMLNATNPVLGANWTLQCRHAERGIESKPDPNSDVVSISTDMRTLSVRLRTESIDQLRVLVECDP